MTTPYAGVPGTPPADSVGYGFGVQVVRRGGRLIWQHNGAINGFDAQVVMFPESRVSVVLIDNLAGNPLAGIIDGALRLAAGITPEPGSPPPPPREPTADERTALAGTYAMGGRTIVISEVNGTLQATMAPIQGTIRMSGDDALIFTPRGGGGAPTRFVITRDATGRVTYLHTGGRALARQYRQG